MAKVSSLEDLLVEELKDLFDAENQLTRALPKMAKAATAPELKAAFEEHLEVTKQQVERLTHVFEELGKPAKGKRCEAMKGLITEGDEIMKMTGDPTAKDAAIIAAAQRVEHYEIAAWGTVRQLAKEYGYDGIEDIAGQTLDEEYQADKLLTKIATGGMFKTGVNQRATN